MLRKKMEFTLWEYTRNICTTGGETKNWARTNQLLNEAFSKVGQHSHYSLFIEKWKIIAELIQKCELESNLDTILKKKNCA